ncbi:IclR family transcriptional regulator [Phyllobacterium sp. SB3]|uniref:IclR family transcriptional regulator n=1 Tax=Phyllobacterium sp. SB3 TaxID=3156073 RepID=UPI0032AF3797
MPVAEEVTTKNSDGGGIQSLHRAMSILQVVAHAREGVGLADLCKEIGLHSSTTFHLAKTLVTLGLLRQDAQSKRYRVGSTLFGLATGALDEIEILNVASPFLTQLALDTGESSHIAVLAGKDVVIIGKQDAAASIRLAERVGSARPSYATAIGKAMLSGFTAMMLDEYFEKTDLVSITPKTVTDIDTLRKAIEDVRETGIAFDDGEFDSEVRCLASPVFDFRGQVIAAIGITAPMFRMTLGKISEVSDQVKRAARQLGAQFGAEGQTVQNN